jgi:hypothetical protein
LNNYNYDIYLYDEENNIKKFYYSLSNFEYENAKITCDRYSVLRRGRNQKVISYSLFGTNKFYYEKLKEITKEAKKVYPDWLIRIYYDYSIDKSIICDIECENYDNSDFCNINQLNRNLIDNNDESLLNANYIHKMMWRYFPLADDFVDLASFRDTDSFIIQREIDSVNVWLNSDKIGHIMRDHPEHNIKILGGMWGFKMRNNRELANKIFQMIIDKKLSYKYNYQYKSPKGYDQFFLVDYVFNLIKKNSVIHDILFLCLLHLLLSQDNITL